MIIVNYLERLGQSWTVNKNSTSHQVLKFLGNLATLFMLYIPTQKTSNTILIPVQLCIKKTFPEELPKVRGLTIPTSFVWREDQYSKSLYSK